jgi:hypothetical protein
MRRFVSLEQRLAGHLPEFAGRRIRRTVFDHAHQRGLRDRIQRSLDDTVLTFELDRLLYDIEVEAQSAWLRRLAAFDAYCARRDAPGGGPAEPPVR